IDKKTVKIPDEYDLLMIIAPKDADISEHEAKIIDEYVRAGGSLIALHDGVYVNQQYMMAQKNEALFSALYEKWDVKLRSEIVYDLRKNMMVQAGDSRSQVLVPYPYIINSTINTLAPIAKKIENVVVQWASPVVIMNESNKTISTILTTSGDAGTTSDNFDINPTTMKLSTKDLGERVLGVQVKPSKGFALIIGDSDFASDGVASEVPQNLALILNAVDLYTGGQGLSEIKSKQASVGKLEVESASQYETLRFGNIIASCAVIIFFGAYRLTTRMRRKNMMYGDYQYQDSEEDDSIEDDEDDAENEELDESEEADEQLTEEDDNNK
ncbi:MAG: Gldg family protein, partial [Rubrobacteridae bacterium]|nr:Gldg family protein [Rubrobacteridae bacterium]